MHSKPSSMFTIRSRSNFSPPSFSLILARDVCRWGLSQPGGWRLGDCCKMKDAKGLEEENADASCSRGCDTFPGMIPVFIYISGSPKTVHRRSNSRSVRWTTAHVAHSILVFLVHSGLDVAAQDARKQAVNSSNQHQSAPTNSQ